MEQEMQALIYKFPQNYKNHNPQWASFAIRDAHYCGCVFLWVLDKENTSSLLAADQIKYFISAFMCRS